MVTDNTDDVCVEELETKDLPEQLDIAPVLESKPRQVDDTLARLTRLNNSPSLHANLAPEDDCALVIHQIEELSDGPALTILIEAIQEHTGAFRRSLRDICTCY